MGHNVPRVSIGTVSNIIFFLTGQVTRAYVTSADKSNNECGFDSCYQSGGPKKEKESTKNWSGTLLPQKTI